jgi:hypothetical protein
MIMQAREIPECISSLRRLRIDKLWLRGFTEPQLEKVIPDIVKNPEYRRYIIVSDDTIVSQAALDSILKWQEEFDVLTGWCNVSLQTWRANVLFRPPPFWNDTYYRITRLMPQASGAKVRYYTDTRTLLKRMYESTLLSNFPACSEVLRKPPVFRTYYVGWALTSMSRDMWLYYGFRFPRWKDHASGSDDLMSRIMNADGVKMWCSRDSFIYHLNTMRNFIVGRVTPTVIREKASPV